MKGNDKTIILLSGKAGSGKDTALSFFQDYFGDRCQRFAFADSLKRIAIDSFQWDGVKNEQGRWLLINLAQMMKGEFTYSNGYFTIDGREYHLWDNIYNQYRTIDVFFKLFSLHQPSKSFWAEQVLNPIEKADTEYCIITDFRFFIEYQTLAKLKNVRLFTVKILRDEAEDINDRSETELNNLDFEFYIPNNDSLEEFKFNIEDFCGYLERSK